MLDAKDNGTNKHRYVVACQEQEVRAMCRRIKGVPLVYINRSVMILEPMSDISESVRLKEEKGKFRFGLKGKAPTNGSLLGKRRREESADSDDGSAGEDGDDTQAEPVRKKKRKFGVKGPNPLSMKKKKRKPMVVTAAKRETNGTAPDGDEAKKRRFRKRKTADEAVAKED